MKRATTYKTYGRSATARESVTSKQFDEIMKPKEKEVCKRNSPFGASDSSTNSCKNEDVEHLDSYHSRRPVRRCARGKRIILPDGNASKDSIHDHSNSTTNIIKNASNTSMPLCENNSMNNLSNEILSPPIKQSKRGGLRHHDVNVKAAKKKNHKKAQKCEADKENSLCDIDKHLNFTDIEQDSLIIESDQIAKDNIPHSSTPNPQPKDEFFSLPLKSDSKDMDVSHISKDDKSDSYSFVQCSLQDDDSVIPLLSHNVTLRRSSRNSKRSSLWGKLMEKNILFQNNIQTCDGNSISADSVPDVREQNSLTEIDESNISSLSIISENSKLSDEHSSDASILESDIDIENNIQDSRENKEIDADLSLYKCNIAEQERHFLRVMPEISEIEEDIFSSEDIISNSRLSVSQERSFYEKLTCSSLHEGEQESIEERLLGLCDQTEYIGYSSCIPQRMMSECIKIGEGVYGEVFRSTRRGQSVAIKIVPIEGDFEVNDCPQKRFDEILPEVIIAKELSDLATGSSNKSGNFCQMNRVSCVQDSFPDHLLKKWDEYSKRKCSENDRPDMFPDNQLFMVFEFVDGGCALENFQFSNYTQAFSVLRQVVFALAVAERALEFEHRDLHIGNVLVKACKDDTVTFTFEDREYPFPSEGVFATIIDFTISRLKKDGCAVFCDVSTDDGLFEGTGDIQFDVYRDMKQENDNDWSKFCPHSNILWVQYLCEKLNTVIKYTDTGRNHRDAQRRLRHMSSVIQDFPSCENLAMDLSLWVL